MDKYLYFLLFFFLNLFYPFSNEIDFPGIGFGIDDKFIVSFEYNTGGGVAEPPFAVPVPPAEIRLPGLFGFEYCIDIIIILGILGYFIPIIGESIDSTHKIIGVFIQIGSITDIPFTDDQFHFLTICHSKGTEGFFHCLYLRIKCEYRNKNKD